jgi:membrane protease subunit (stomatin/prohibitin family)
MAIINRVKFDGLANREWLVFKHPSEQLVFGTQLIVGEGQTAVFVRGGNICDVFHAGTYTLDAYNLPILQGLLNIPFGGKTPFPAEIFYLNNVTKLDITWGTSDPILLVDPKYSTRLHIRAFGQMGLKLNDCGKFVQELIGVLQPTQLVKFDVLRQYFKGVVVQKIKIIISDIIINRKISALEITPHMDEISEYATQRITGEFQRYGLDVANFFIQSINFPDEDFDAINAVLEKRAAFDLMGDARYATARTFDVYEGAANNSSGVAGAFMAGGIGLGAGMNMSQQMPTVMSNTSPTGIFCPKCHTNNPAGTKFCSNCGENLVVQQTDEIKCHQCGADVQQGAKFCFECGASLLPKKCSECGEDILPKSKFCSKCGKEV